MANYYFEGDGLYPLTMEPNTPTTTFVASGIPDGAIVTVGRSTASGWTPLTNGVLQNHLPVALSHGQDVDLSVLVNGAGSEVIVLDTQKQGVPEYYNILNQIAENTAAMCNSGLPYVTQEDYDAGQLAQDQRLDALETIQEEHPGHELSVLRVAWKPTGTYPILQVPEPDGVPNPIEYTDLTNPSTHVTVDLAAGVFTFDVDCSVATISVSCQIMRESGAGGNATWGFFFESFNPDSGLWEESPDSIRFITLNNQTDNEYRAIQYTVGGGPITAGSKLRLSHITDSTAANFGLVTDKPFANAPASAGAVVTITTERILEST